jgi:hypothetical protein
MAGKMISGVRHDGEIGAFGSIPLSFRGHGGGGGELSRTVTAFLL